jgi:MFS family permease
LAVQFILGIIADRFDRTRMLLIIAAAMAVVALLITLIGDAPFLLILIEMGLFGGLIFAVYPLAVARTHDIFEPKDAVAVSSALLLCYSIGAIFGPIGASTAMAVTQSPYGLFAFWALVSAVYASGIVYLQHRERIKVVRLEDQVEFMPMKSTSPIAMVLDPRSEYDDRIS